MRAEVLLVESFRERAREITLLMDQNPEFAGIVEDYSDARKAYSLWEQKGEGYQETEDYRVLINELEQEILALLDAANVGNDCSDI